MSDDIHLLRLHWRKFEITSIAKRLKFGLTSFDGPIAHAAVVGLDPVAC
jgi:hypothetical protein